jgi:hypothetical protein
MSRIITLDVGGYLMQAVEAAANTLMEAEAAALVKASYYERNGQRATYRNGYRLRQWQTPAEAVTLYIPKLRSGSYYPAFLSEPAAALRFVALAESALIRTPTIAEVMDLLTFPNTETARHVAETLQQQANAYFNRPLRDSLSTVFIHRQADLWMLYAATASGAYHLLDVFEDHDKRPHWKAVLRRLYKRGLHHIEAFEGDLSPEFERVRQDLYPYSDTYATDSQQVQVVLGMPLPTLGEQVTQPTLQLYHIVSGQLPLHVDSRALRLLRYMLQDAQYAVGQPLAAI